MSDGLSKAQRRHLIEMVNDHGETRFWRPQNSGQHSCARALRAKGLLAGSYSTYSDGYYLTDAGLDMANALALGLVPSERSTP